MHITRYTDYSLRVLIYLTLNQGQRSTIKEIADSYGISKNHLMKVVHNLNKAGYIETLRGKKGGLKLGLEPKAINIGQLVRELEPDFNLVECFSPKGNCTITPVCQLQSIIGRALAAFVNELNQYTLADVIDGRSEQQAMELLGLSSERTEERDVIFAQSIN